MIIDIIGLPGSGKSFLAEEIAEDLNRRNIDNINVLRYERYTFKGKLINRIKKEFIKKFRYTNRIREELCIILKDELYLKSIYNKDRNIDYYIDHIAISIYRYSKLMRRKKVYIFDEGIYHALATLCMDYNISNDIFLNLLLFCKSKLGENNIIYNKISVKDCLQSIKQRNRKQCDIDELSDEMTYQMLRAYENYFMLIEKEINIISVSRNESSAEKIRKISSVYVRRN